MSDESSDSEVATPDWIGRPVMVTQEVFNGSGYDTKPWYDGIVSRVSQCGYWVEVEAIINHGWFWWSKPTTEFEWHDVDDVYLVLEGKS